MYVPQNIENINVCIDVFMTFDRRVDDYRFIEKYIILRNTFECETPRRKLESPYQEN